jgi:hypothetical protein
VTDADSSHHDDRIRRGLRTILTPSTWNAAPQRRANHSLIDGIGSRIGQRATRSRSQQTIRDHLPFGPPNRPTIGTGKYRSRERVAEMIAAGLGAGTPLITRRRRQATASPFGAIGQAGHRCHLRHHRTSRHPSMRPPTRSRYSLCQIGNEQIEAFIDRRVDERVQSSTPPDGRTGI